MCIGAMPVHAFLAESVSCYRNIGESGQLGCTLIVWLSQQSFSSHAFYSIRNTKVLILRPSICFWNFACFTAGNKSSLCVQNPLG